jgi:hypothetical protein
MNHRMNPSPRIKFSPQREVELLVQIVSGLAASGHFTFSIDDFDADDLTDEPMSVLRTYARSSPSPDGTTRVTGEMLITDVAHAILDQLRQDVEERIENCPELYRDLAADQFPTEWTRVDRTDDESLTLSEWDALEASTRKQILEGLDRWRADDQRIEAIFADLKRSRASNNTLQCKPWSYQGLNLSR